METQTPNLLQTIEGINSITKDSALDKTKIKEADSYLQTLASAENISAEEALLLSATIEISSDEIGANLRSFTEFFKCSNVQILLYEPFFQSLINKGFIRLHVSRGRLNLYIPSRDFMTSLLNNQPYQKPEHKNLGLRSFLDVYDSFENERYSHSLVYDIFISDVKRLVLDNPHLKLCSFILNNDLLSPTYEPFLVFMLKASADIMKYGKNHIYRHSCESILDDHSERLLTLALDTFSTKGEPHQVFEPAITVTNQLADEDGYCFTSRFCKKYLAGLQIKTLKQKNNNSDGYINCARIIPKKLFFNPDEEKLIHELSSLLKPRNFKRIQTQLEKQGYRTGFATLFYGSPGTGKTETALQLAKMTGRDIIQVDLSEIRDKYVGESEKLTKAIFDDYRYIKEESKLAPILLLNEADGLLSKRITSIDHSVDQMENTMQNIILQEMETFDGILIATTNLTCNLDLAFERRFLYKVEFHRPSADARASIWKTMISDLKPSDAKIMADEFDFTGGEIENIARKYVINNILHNTKTNLNSLRQICRTEKLSKTESRKTIGF